MISTQISSGPKTASVVARAAKSLLKFKPPTLHSIAGSPAWPTRQVLSDTDTLEDAVVPLKILEAVL